MSDNTRKNKKTKSNNASKAGYAVGGFVAGVATGAAATSAAQNSNSSPQHVDNNVIEPQPQNPNNGGNVIETIEEHPTQQDQQQNQQSEDNQQVVETTTYAPIAHVSDNLTFAQAFAEARHQVGPGGVFEWHGNVYGTFYANEWENMSAAQRAEYHSHIDYQSAHDEHVRYYGEYHHSNPTHETHENHEVSDNKENPNATRTDIDPEDSVKVLTIQQVDCEFGKDGKAIIAEVTFDGQPIVLFDLNNDGHFDLLVADLNNDGQLDDNEVIDVAKDNIELVDLADKYNGQFQVFVNGQPYTGGDNDVDPTHGMYVDVDDINHDYHNDEEIS